MSSILRKSGKDPLIFTFMPIVPQEGDKPIIKFPAFINSISDSHSPSWSSNMDIGRADPKWKYSQYSRTITVNFITAALYDGEHKFYMKTLNALAQITKPVYKPGRGFNGVFTRLQIGDFIKEYGIITSLTFDINNDSPWIDNLPIYINGSVTLQAIGIKKPDFNDGKYYYGKENQKNEGKIVPG